MGPTRTVRSKHVSKGVNKPTGKGSAKSPISKPRPNKKKPALPTPKQQKTKSAASLPSRRKKERKYTEAELDIPTLNTIVPAGVQIPKGKKKGKVFVDDAESMMTILAIVNAEKEGQIESKMIKSRQMEEIREARKQETEKRQAMRQDKLEQTKGALKRKRKRPIAGEQSTQPEAKTKSKRVSFA